MTTFYIKTLGCKVNTFDSEALQQKLTTAGFLKVESASLADVVVINSCSVTQKATAETRYLLRRFKRERPQSFRVVTGCYAQIDSKNLAALSEVDLIIPNESKHTFVETLTKRLLSGKNEGHSKLPPGDKSVADNKQSQFKSSVVLFDTPQVERTRVFLKVQDGCNGFCAYCQIPYARGSSKSVPKEKILEAASSIMSQGVCEIVLTGIHVGDYGKDFSDSKKETFSSLVASLIKTPGLKRLRISSLEPSEVTKELLLCLFEHKNIFCDHFHLPLQSGSDKILKSMGRSYSTHQYKKNISLIRTYFPKCNITADVIPGFPGETEKDFEETLNFIEECDLNGLHVFPYSKRPNTRALKMTGHLNPETIKKRASILKKKSEILYKKYAKNFIGEKKEVLWEGTKEKRTLGKTKNYLPVLSKENLSLKKGDCSFIEIKGFYDEKNLLGI